MKRKEQTGDRKGNCPGSIVENMEIMKKEAQKRQLGHPNYVNKKNPKTENREWGGKIFGSIISDKLA